MPISDVSECNTEVNWPLCGHPLQKWHDCHWSFCCSSIYILRRILPQKEECILWSCQVCICINNYHDDKSILCNFNVYYHIIDIQTLQLRKIMNFQLKFCTGHILKICSFSSVLSQCKLYVSFLFALNAR